MRNLAEFYYPLRLVVRRIFAYLQDTIIYEFPWFEPSSKTLEVLESKKGRANLSPKHIAADFLTFLAICILLVVLIFVSLKCPKDDEDDDEEEENVEQISPVSALNETIPDSSQSSVYSMSLQSNESKNYITHDRGDSSSTQRLELDIPTINLSDHNHSFLNFHEYIDEGESSQASTASMLETSGTISERQPLSPRKINTYSRICKRLIKQPHNQMGLAYDHEWCVRRTRSGQIYGKYQI